VTTINNVYIIKVGVMDGQIIAAHGDYKLNSNFQTKYHISMYPVFKITKKSKQINNNQIN